MKRLVQTIKLNSRSMAMRKRMLSYLVPLIFLLYLILFVILYFSGAFNTVESRTMQTLEAEASTTGSSLAEMLEDLAARGISLSKSLTEVIEECLEENGWQFSSLEDNYSAIDAVEIAAYDQLLWAIEVSDCSGAFMVLDTTVNTSVEYAEYSRSGLYLKMQNVSISRPVSPDVKLFRGSNAVAHAVGTDLYPQWELEFDIQSLPLFPENNEGESLVESYFYTDSVELPGARDKAMYLVVPIYGSESELYGYCGFEVSSTYFRLNMAHKEDSDGKPFTILARSSEDTLHSLYGMADNQTYNHHSNAVKSNLETTQYGSFKRYTSEAGESYLGVEKDIYISPNNSDWVIAVMMPQSQYDKELGQHSATIAVLSLVFLAIAISAAVLISNIYVKQIHSGLEMVKTRDAGKKSNIQEIDDLMEYLAQQDALRAPSKGQSIDTESIDEKKLGIFIENVKSLTLAERSVYNLYLEGLRAQEIADSLFISINTVRAHSKQIYRKLDINSRKELLTYARSMKEREPKSSDSQ